MSLFLHTDRATRGDVFFSFHFSALGADAQPIEETAGGVEMHKFAKSKAHSVIFVAGVKGEIQMEICRRRRYQELWVLRPD